MKRKNPLIKRGSHHAPDTEVIVDHLRRSRLITIIEDYLIANSDQPVESYDYAIAYSIHAMLQRLITGIYQAQVSQDDNDRNDELIDSIDADIQFKYKV